MRIKNFFPSNNLKSEGLFIEEMRNLKQIVAIFGKNGAGKSRLLRELRNEILLSQQEIRPIYNFISHYENSTQNPHPQIHEQEQKIYEENKMKWNNFIENFEIESINESPIIISAFSSAIDTNLSMQDTDYRERANNIIQNPTYENVKKDCPKFIKALIKSEISNDYHKFVHDKNKHFTKHDENTERNINLLQSLKITIKEIMDKDLTYTLDEHLTPIIILDGRALNVNELSSGEKEILSFCVYLVLQSQKQILNESVSLKNKILILDEPDLFIHPKSQIDLIKGLRKLVDKGQIWIATHSLAFLSILDRDEIWLMEHGKISSPSIETPNKVLASLIGEDNIDSLENFISSQYEWASIQFAFECLFPPMIIENKKDDPQTEQVIKVLTKPNKGMKILDFGAGYGRFAMELLRNSEVAEKIYYQPYEINNNCYPKLKELSSQLQNISKIESNVNREIIDNYLKLKEPQFTEFFDYVLLINVLHEIPINKWNSELKAILNSLKKGGKILILEDQSIPRGENAHEYGFLIFDIEEFQLLFSLKNKPKEYVHPDAKYKDRLKCIEIEKGTAEVNIDSIYNSLLRKKTNCSTSIKTIKEIKSKKPRDGRRISFFTQLYANVDMASEEIKPKA